MTHKELFFDLITLWVTIDPLGTLPLFLSVTKTMSPASAEPPPFAPRSSRF